MLVDVFSSVKLQAFACERENGASHVRVRKRMRGEVVLAVYPGLICRSPWWGACGKGGKDVVVDSGAWSSFGSILLEAV